MRGVGYSAINTARSALSSVSTMLGGEKFGDNPIICRFMKGIFNLRPTQAKYTHIWDPEIALKFLDMDSDKLSLLEFSRKIVFLVTLLSGQRVATIANLKLSDVSLTETKIVIIVGKVKQSRPGYHQEPLRFQKFVDKPNICVVTQLSNYIQRTKDIR
jgi:integrase